MNINNAHKILFIGIGGIGMSALARYFNKKGVEVYGYDKTPSPITQQLCSEGIKVFFTESIQEIKAGTNLVIYTPAIAPSNKLLLEVTSKNIPLYKRSEILGLLSKQYKCIAIAGTHGKTSVTSLVAHILQSSGVAILAFIGGISLNYNSNLIYNENPEYIIVEADEYDRSFLHLHPDISLITAIAADHLDIYGTLEAVHEAFKAFANRNAPNGSVIIHQNLLNICCGDMSYGLHSGSRYFATNITIKNHRYEYKISTPQDILSTHSTIPGKHNIENSIAAVAIAKTIGISNKQILKALESYRGVQRRFEVVVSNNEHVYIDDYAHHPEEIEACISTVRELYPNSKITGVFQPHLYSRTRDLATEFAKAMSLLDQAVVLDIYPAREEPIEKVDASLIYDRITCDEKYMLRKNQLPEWVEKNKPNILITMGAGDIDRLVPQIKSILEKNND